MDGMRAGVWLYALATIATGIVNIVWRKFEASHQPIDALGHLPGETVIAVLVGLCLIAAGIALLRRQTAWGGAVASALIYSVFALSWISRYAAMTHTLGFRSGILVFCAGGAAMQLLLAAPVIVLYAATHPTSFVHRKALMIARWTIGVPPIACGMGHLISIHGYVPFVPHWVPFGEFFVIFTGIAFLLAGCAILAEIRVVLAARMLALMLFLFEFMVEIPPVFANRHSQGAWGGAIYNVAAIGALWMFAELAGRRCESIREIDPGEHLATVRAGTTV